MTLDLDELERLEREATPGPWDMCRFGPDVVVHGTGWSLYRHDREFVVAARNALPALLAELRALRVVAEAAARVDDHETVLGNCDANPCIFCDSLRDMRRALDAWRGLR
jgi:hypothetical protein